jgi:hypothetical protein
MTDQSVFPELTFDETTTSHMVCRSVFVIEAHEEKAARAKHLLVKSSACHLRRRTSSMAKKSARGSRCEAYQVALNQRMAAKRAELKRNWVTSKVWPSFRVTAAPTRRTNRCIETGRPRAYMRQFGLSTHHVSVSMQARAKSQA